MEHTYTSTVTEENGRWRWTVKRSDWSRALTGTRKRQKEAEAEVRAQIKFSEKMARRDRA